MSELATVKQEATVCDWCGHNHIKGDRCIYNCPCGQSAPAIPAVKEKDKPESERLKINSLLGVLCDQLQQYGVECIQVTFDGYGDSGSIDESEFYQVSAAKEVENADINADKVMQEIVEELLPAGWDINEGSSGQILVWVVAGVVDYEYNDRYEARHDADYYNQPALPEDLRQRAAEAGIAEFIVEYSGFGDSGSIDYVDLPEGTHDALRQEIETWADDAANSLGYDWWNNDGGSGKITVDITTGEVAVEAYFFETKTELSQSIWRFR